MLRKPEGQAHNREHNRRHNPPPRQALHREADKPDLEVSQADADGVDVEVFLRRHMDSAIRP
jgi:hypothetical protein